MVNWSVRSNSNFQSAARQAIFKFLLRETNCKYYEILVKLRRNNKVKLGIQFCLHPDNPDIQDK